MSHGPHRFRESEMRRALRAMAALRIPVGRIDFDKNGGFAIIPGKATETSGERNEWDEVLGDGTASEIR